MNQPQSSRRLESLDALRGFDMFFIMGGAALIASLATWFPTPFFQALAGQMHHAAWNGLTHHDTIFPLFLFIAGISFPFSLAKQRQNKTPKQIYGKIFSRGIKLVFLGVVYNGLLHFDFDTLRYASVLGRIGLGWMFAALIFMQTNTRARIGLIATILIGYGLLLGLVSAPDAPAGATPYSIEGSLAGYIDRMWLPGRLHNGIHDPEGLLTTLPSIATALLGMLCGEWIQRRPEHLNGTHKTIGLLVTGSLLILTGWALSPLCPINKNLWTSTFVCVVGGISMLVFALFYYIIDVRGWRWWTPFFTVIGLNSITIYLAQEFISFGFTSQALFGGLIGLCPEAMQPFAAHAAYIAVCWLFLYALYRNRIFLKV